MMQRLGRLAWIAGCSFVAWWIFRGDPNEAWWAAVIGGAIGMATSLRGVTRFSLALAFGLAAGGLSFKLGIHSDYWLFWFAGGAMAGLAIPVQAIPLRTMWRGGVTRLARMIERARGA